MSDENDRMDIDSRTYGDFRHPGPDTNPDHEEEDEEKTLVNGNDDCIAAWGVCNHAFHLHCIQRWLKSRHVCPLDNREWTYQKFGN